MFTILRAGAVLMAMMVGVACGGDATTSGAGGSGDGGAGATGGGGADGFPNQSTVVLDGFESCGLDAPGYWQNLYGDYMAIAVGEIEAPFAVSAITIRMYNFADPRCAASAPFDLLFFVDPSTTATVWNGPEAPTWIPIDRMEITTGVDAAAGEISDVTWTLTKPVVIEDTGLLWIGYGAEAGPDGAPVSCVAACPDDTVPQNAWRWTGGMGGFASTTAHPYVSVEIGKP